MMLGKYSNLFLDRDGIINEVVLRGQLISSPRMVEEFKFRNDFLQFAHLLEAKYRCFVVTNQPDIARGLLSLGDLEKMHSIILSRLAIEEIVICPHDDRDNCQCRKPKAGMINDIVKRYALEKSESLMIGDSEKDVASASNAGIDCVYLKTEYNAPLCRVRNIQTLVELIDK